VKTSQGNQLENESVEAINIEALDKEDSLPLLGEFPDEVLQVCVREAMGRPVEARAQVVHKPPIGLVSIPS
jgi:hypothetical protein